MLAAMMDIDELQQSILIVVIESDNLKRMKKADPITLESINNRGALKPPKYPQNFNTLIAYEEDDATLWAKAKRNPVEMLRWLERGRIFDPKTDGMKNAFKMSRDPEPSK